MNIKRIKYKAIDSTTKVREAFEFFKNSFLFTRQKEDSEFLPMHEIYQMMIDNINQTFMFQFVATHENIVVGCVIASVIDGEMFIPVLAVDHKYRGSGIASKLLAKITRMAKRAQANIIKIIPSFVSAPYFIKRGFVGYAFVQVPPPANIEHIKAANLSNLELVSASENVAKFNFPVLDKQLLRPFKVIPGTQISVIFEKNI